MSLSERATLRRLGIVRIGIGLLVVLRTIPSLGFWHIARFVPETPLLGWPHAGWTLTAGPFLPPAVTALLCGVRTVAAVALALGIFTPWSGLVCGAAGFIVMSQDLFGSSNTLRLLFGACLLLAATDSGSSLAVRPSRPRSPESSIALMRAFVVSIYAWAAFAKLDVDWLSGRTLQLFRDDGLIRGSLAEMALATPIRASITATLVLLTEALLAVGLSLRRTRRAALVVAVLVQIGFECVARPDVFGFAMLSMLVVFVEPKVATSVTSSGVAEAPPSERGDVRFMVHREKRDG